MKPEWLEDDMIPFEWAGYLGMAVKAARDAGCLLRQKFGRVEQLEFKGATDLVTEADRISEELICGSILESYPTHRILAEERGEVGEGGAYRWVIDPLDGTTNFVHGLPFFAVSIALECDGAPIVGVVYAPVLHETFIAVAGAGAFHNGQRIGVSSTDGLRNALLATGFPRSAERGHWNTDHVANFVPLVRGLRRLGAAALDMSYVACGKLDGYWETRLGEWDVAAGRLLVREAGGVVTDFRGREIKDFSGQIAASNGPLHDQIIAVLARGATGQEGLAVLP